MPEQIVIVGAGGHARVVLDLLDTLGCYQTAGLTDPDSLKWSTPLLGYQVLGDDDLLPGLLEKGVSLACIGVGSVTAQGNGFRRDLFQLVRRLGFTVPNLQHPRAIVSRFCQLHQGVTIMAGAIVNPGVVLGDNVLVNTGALIEHDCILEPHAHIAPGAKLAGGVVVREGAYVGMGAMVKQGVEISRWATVGSGAVVLGHVPEGATVAGVPARPVRSNTENP